MSYRILEELSGERVRYESMHGEQTGQRIGRLVVRDEPLLLVTGTCSICKASFVDRRVFVIDNLDADVAVAGFVRREMVLLAADVVSARGENELVKHYLEELLHRDHASGEPLSFNEWRSMLS